MDYHLKCELCGEEVQVDSKSTSPLGAHLLVRHPDVDLTYFSSFEDLTVGRNHICVNKFKDFIEDKNGLGTDKNQFIGNSLPTNLIYKYNTGKKALKKNVNLQTYRPQTTKTALKKNVISTTIESWKISTCKFLCPKCGIKDRPEIRVRTTNIIHAPTNRFLLMACWPLCFWPMFNSASSEKRLFCRSCGNDLGDFNHFKCTCSCVS